MGVGDASDNGYAFAEEVVMERQSVYFLGVGSVEIDPVRSAESVCDLPSNRSKTYQLVPGMAIYSNEFRGAPC